MAHISNTGLYHADLNSDLSAVCTRCPCFLIQILIWTQNDHSFIAFALYVTEGYINGIFSAICRSDLRDADIFTIWLYHRVRGNITNSMHTR